MPRIKTNKIIHKEFCYQITGLLFKVHNELGRFCREKQYSDLFEKKLKQNKIIYEREKVLPLKASPISNRVDFKIDNKILLDCKTKRLITKEDYYQMQRYLIAAELKLGLIVNFRDRYLKPKRVINSKI